ncbi:hypothetical protein [Lysinibacillus fusiformis]|uniref:hypothetical protein n=1 Tax=Lysinibacillus fusiformis TaxID=28031 RepID=UPI003D081D2D
MSETVRIGRPPTAPTPQRDRTGLHVVLAGVLLLLASVGAVLGVVLGNRHPQAAQQPSASPTERAPGSAISELATCVAMIPLLQQAIDEMGAFKEDPLRSPADMAATAKTLRDLEAGAPETWRTDMAIMYSELQKIVDADRDPAKLYQLNLDTDTWADSGQRLVHGCLPYAVS